MNINEATEILIQWLPVNRWPPNPNLLQAMTLGIEALKEVMRTRDGDPALDGELLPGETED